MLFEILQTTSPKIIVDIANNEILDCGSILISYNFLKPLQMLKCPENYCKKGLEQP